MPNRRGGILLTSTSGSMRLMILNMLQQPLGRSNARKVNRLDPAIGGLQALAKRQRHRFKIRLQERVVSARQGIEDAIVLRVACH